MAKVGFWLRGAYGKLGGATLFKSDGATQIRDLPVKTKNPRTNGQMIQRAIMATIMKAYSAGKGIFDHSFEGKAVGAHNQREFMRLNLNYLRKALVEANSQARVVGPKALSPVANSYIVSRGSFPQTIFGQSLNTIVNNNGNYRIYFPSATTDEEVSAYMSRVGLNPGDIYTFIVFGVNPEYVESEYGYDDYNARQCAGNFAFVRLIVKSVTVTGTMAAQNLSDIFVITASDAAIAENLKANATMGDFMFNADPLYGFSIQALCGEGFTQGAIGCIRSREDTGVRSNTQLSLIVPVDYGIDYEWLLPIWKQDSTSLGDSNLILEGGSGSTRAVTPSTPTTPYVSAMTVNGVVTALGSTVNRDHMQIVPVNLQLITQNIEDITDSDHAPKIRNIWHDGSVSTEGIITSRSQNVSIDIAVAGSGDIVLTDYQDNVLQTLFHLVVS